MATHPSSSNSSANDSGVMQTTNSIREEEAEAQEVVMDLEDLVVKIVQFNGLTSMVAMLRESHLSILLITLRDDQALTIWDSDQ